MMRIGSSIRSALFAAVLLAIAAAAYGQINISVSFAPPELPVYEQPLCPGDGYLWTPGYWAYANDYDDYTTTVNRISYNGGAGGISARPRPEEEAAARERHIPPVPVQAQHVQAAHAQQELRASVNHGTPPVAAPPKPGAFNDRAVTPARAAGTPYNPPPNRAAVQSLGNAPVVQPRNGAARADQASPNNRPGPNRPPSAQPNNRPEPNRAEPSRPESNRPPIAEPDFRPESNRPPSLQPNNRPEPNRNEPQRSQAAPLNERSQPQHTSPPAEARSAPQQRPQPAPMKAEEKKQQNEQPKRDEKPQQ